MRCYIDDYRIIKIKDADVFEADMATVYSDGEVLPYSLTREANTFILETEKDIDITKDNYLIYDNDRFEFEYRFIVHTDRFDRENVPDVKTLGAFPEGDKTIFRIWAPFKKGVNLLIGKEKYRMTLKDKWVYEYVLEGNNDGLTYRYELVANNSIAVIQDPFSYVNSAYESYVTDINKTDRNKVHLNKTEDPIIYEISIRDFSSAGNFEHPRKLKALGEDKALDYLKSLGISHIQIMPMLDYDDDKGDYNWGYNPVHYNVFKQDYLCDLSPYGQIREVQDVFNRLHENGLKVVLDVVFNHVYKPEEYVLNKLLPYYFYRYKDGMKSDGTGLGNEVRTESAFFRQYFILVCKRLAEIYDIDGLRFDLSGIIDLDSMKQLQKEISLIKEDFLFINEGWNMGDTLPEYKRVCFENACSFKEGIFFNAGFRNDIKQYALGLQENRPQAMLALTGSYKYPSGRQSLNYVECHDDETFYDYLVLNGLDAKDLKQRCKFALAFVLLSKGVPFIHSGEEFLRTKKGCRNSYNAPDEINKFDWNLLEENRDTVEYVKELIRLRRMLKINETEEGKFRDYFEVLIYESGDYLFLINPCPYDHVYEDGNAYRIIYDGEKMTDFIQKDFLVKEYTFMILKRL